MNHERRRAINSVPKAIILIAFVGLISNCRAQSERILDIAVAVGSNEPAALVVTFPAVGEYLIEATQRNIDVILSFVPGGGAPAISTNAPFGRDGTERLIVSAPTSLNGKIVVAASTHGGPRRDVQISITPFVETGGALTLRTNALRLMAKATATPDSGIGRDSEKALIRLREARALWRQSGNTAEQAWAQYAIAMTLYWKLFEWQRSADAAVKATDLFRQAGLTGMSQKARALQATAIMEVAYSNSQSGDQTTRAQLYALADEILHSASAKQKQLDRLYDQAETINNIGLNYYYQEDWEQARDYFWQAALRFRELDEFLDEQTPLSNIGVISFEQGDLQETIRISKAVLATLDQLELSNRKSLRANTLTDLGFAQQALGDFEAALNSFTEAMTLHEQSDDASGRARALGGLARTYSGVGDVSRAVDYFKQVLAIRRYLEEGMARFDALIDLGDAHRIDNAPDRALELHREAHASAVSPVSRANALNSIGWDLGDLGDFDAALRAFEEARALAEGANSISQTAEALHGLGEAQYALGDESSRETLLQAANMYRSLDLLVPEARSLISLSRAHRAGGDFDDALTTITRAQALVESRRAEFSRPTFRALFVGTLHEVYEAHWSLLLEMSGKTRANSPDDSVRLLKEALTVSDNGRGQVLREYLGTARIQRSEAADEREKKLREKLIGQLHLRKVMREQSESSETFSDVDVARNLQAIAKLTAQLDLADRSIAPPTSQQDPGGLDVQQVQTLLDENTAIIEFALGDAKSVAWVMTQSDVTAVELPARQEIDSLAKAVLEELVGGNRNRDSDARDALARAVYWPALRRIDVKNLVIVADGILQYVPVSSLSRTTTSDQSKGGDKILLRDAFALHYASSIGSWAIQKGKMLERTKATRPLVVFADPVYGENDPRFDVSPVKIASTEPMPTTRFTTRAITSDTLQRLPYSGREATNIASTVGKSQTLEAIDFDASRETFLSTDLGQFRILHFATHGVVDTQHPQLSALVLSTVDAHGQSVDGFIRLSDIRSMKLHADLVVLSACETFLGNNIRGEGLQSLARAFMEAGAAQVVASLWNVPDSSTAQLMEYFYFGLFNEGLTPASSLRKAQQKLASQPLTRSPYHWAGFIVYGADGRTIVPPNPDSG